MKKSDSILGNFFRDILTHLKDAKLIVILYHALLLLILAAIWLLCRIYDLDVSLFTMDPSALTGGMHPLYGALSTLGMFLWSGAASLCLLAAFALKDHLARSQKRFLIWSAILTLYLLFDDAFMIHDFLVPYYLQVDQKFVIIMNFALIFVYLIAFFRVILKTEYTFFLLSAFYMALSVFLDLLADYYYLQISYLIEDGFKILGIASWFIYFFLTASGITRRITAGKNRVRLNDQSQLKNLCNRGIYPFR